MQRSRVAGGARCHVDSQLVSRRPAQSCSRISPAHHPKWHAQHHGNSQAPFAERRAAGGGLGGRAPAIAAGQGRQGAAPALENLPALDVRANASCLAQVAWPVQRELDPHVLHTNPIRRALTADRRALQSGQDAACAQEEPFRCSRYFICTGLLLRCMLCVGWCSGVTDVGLAWRRRRKWARLVLVALTRCRPRDLIRPACVRSRDHDPASVGDY